MKAPTFRGKPSEAHLIWCRSPSDGGAKKRFDEKELRKWCSAYDVDFETGKRVDHERGDEPRPQYRCVFAWTESAGESFDMGDQEWDIQAQKTPETFIEIDSLGLMRVKSWDAEHVLDVREMWWDGPSLVFEATELDGTKRLHARKLRGRDG